MFDQLALGLLVIRVGIGLIYIIHGTGKLMQGPDTWQWLGSQMAHIGISFLPTLWGLLAVGSELIGGTCLILGFYTHVAAPFMAFTMFIAVLYHLKNKDGWTTYSHPLSLFVVFIGLAIAGSGPYSVDALLRQKVIKGEPHA